MVPKVAGKGNSFQGAALYYLHDKDALTSERVEFAHTENLFTRDPDKAIKCMAWTAINANELKARSGASTKGRKLEKPVYSYSLSWAPGQNPTKEQMMEAGRETLRVLGLQDHEALFVSHNDEPHPHLHVIVNRVHPEKGTAAKLANDHLRLSEWAEAYERRMGQILCQQRALNNERRRNGEFVKHPKDRDAEFYRLRRERVNRELEGWEAEKTGLSQTHTKQRKDLFSGKEIRIQQERRAIRERYAPKWERLKDLQKIERSDLRFYQQSASAKVKFFLKEKPSEYIRMDKADRGRFLAEMFQTHSTDATELAQRHKKIRTKLAAEMKQETARAIRPINERYRTDLAALKERQKEETRDLARLQSFESQERARDIKQGRDRARFDKTHREIGETGRSIITPRKLSLSERFRQARERIEESERKDPSNLKDRFRRAAERLQGQDKTEQFRKQGDELTRANDKDKDRESLFRDNASDITRDRGDKGRERDRDRKPPDPKPE